MMTQVFYKDPGIHMYFIARFCLKENLDLLSLPFELVLHSKPFSVTHMSLCFSMLALISQNEHTLYPFHPYVCSAQTVLLCQSSHKDSKFSPKYGFPTTKKRQILPHSSLISDSQNGNFPCTFSSSGFSSTPFMSPGCSRCQSSHKPCHVFNSIQIIVVTIETGEAFHDNLFRHSNQSLIKFKITIPNVRFLPGSMVDSPEATKRNSNKENS